MIKNILLAPLGIFCGALEDMNREELRRVVDKRVARAETAVLRDYLARHGAEGEELEAAVEDFRRQRREEIPSAETVGALAARSAELEAKLARVAVDSAARVQLARLGVSDEYAADVLKLAEDGLREAAERGGDETKAKAAVDTVVARLPALIDPGSRVKDLRGLPPVRSAGLAGNYPRVEAGVSLQQQLDRARDSGDNAAAVAIISQAAKKGVRLR